MRQNLSSNPNQDLIPLGLPRGSVYSPVTSFQVDVYGVPDHSKAERCASTFAEIIFKAQILNFEQFLQGMLYLFFKALYYTRW